MRTRTEILAQPPFEVKVIHEQTEDHQMAIYVSRTSTSDDGVEYIEHRIGVDEWVNDAIPLCWIPCEVWIQITDAIQANVYAELSSSLGELAQALGVAQEGE